MIIEKGGVTSPSGFSAAGVACGIKKNGKKDLAVVCSDIPATAAGVFTTNVVKGHSLQVTMDHIKCGTARAVVVNSGNANACVGEQGQKDALEITALAARLLGCKQQEVLVNSTGVIGMKLDMQAVRSGIENAVAKLSHDGGHEAEEAIMTTDLVPKEIAVQIELGGKKAVIAGMSKGSGMIHPNMATMIGIITTDASISKELLQKALKEITGHTFNRISVDGDTSVCDMVVALANGKAENEEIKTENSDYLAFKDALNTVCTYLARLVAKDGEGATKLIEVNVKGAPSAETAYKIACAVAKSPLVKTAFFGEDANWGRVITAAGYSGASFDPDKVDIYISGLATCRNGVALAFDEAEAKKLLKEKEIDITIDLKSGDFSDRMWTCDFSYDYVKINGSYRS
ncbi:MAG: bifunctional glutamate N-acetyltransferase/amino-acid acetyltransferase ArgJ [Bacillota bacterium]|nr:bifunctional glutamate N-acetyltransferase/amino-acid acetyltransferase ArgJ [Bacillota bacterium]